MPLRKIAPECAPLDRKVLAKTVSGAARQRLAL
jgi:hypothetical protein